MSEKNSLSRREFVAGASGLVLASAAASGGEKAASDPASALAVNGDGAGGREARFIVAPAAKLIHKASIRGIEYV